MDFMYFCDEWWLFSIMYISMCLYVHAHMDIDERSHM